MEHRQIWIDTGGTFTDCLALGPEAKMHRTKVLGSGKLQGRIENTQGKSGRMSYDWGVEADTLRAMSSGPQLKFSSEVQSSDATSLKQTTRR